MIEVTNGEIAGSIESLGLLSRMKWPVLVGLQVQKLVVKLREPAQIIDDVYNGLVDKYGDKQESGETAVIFPGDFQHRPVSAGHIQFLADRKLLMAQTVQVDADKIRLPLEIDGKPLQIEPTILIALEKLLIVE